MVKKRGKLFVITGSSGAGKTTLVQKFLAQPHHAELVTVVPSYTTRDPRLGEVNGVDYYFISREEFERKIRENFFLEWSDAYQEYYGSSYREISQLLDAGTSVLIVVDRFGAQEIKKRLPHDAIIVFVMSPSEQELRKRLQKRGTESDQLIEFRLEQSRQEIVDEQERPIADFVVVNDDLEAALERFAALIRDAL